MSDRSLRCFDRLQSYRVETPILELIFAILCPRRVEWTDHTNIDPLLSYDPFLRRSLWSDLGSVGYQLLAVLFMLIVEWILKGLQR